ncbi:MAG TPA: nucleoside transporter C-terminal domain-containing protein [Verrucomicrobiae bacterium]|nr:nucleoside transporter C-terminal domain-containing protein [Verrucomicrobiae bacterium]
MLGIIVILGTCYLLSANRKAIQFRVVLWGLGLQFLLAVFVMKTRVGYWLLDSTSRKIVWFLNFAKAGSEFVFGKLGDSNTSLGVIFAFQILPVIIFVASVFAILYYLRVIPVLVGLGGKAMFRLLRTSGAESLEVVASILMDQTSAPLVIRPYLGKLTRSELLTIMTAGMAHISGAMMGAYVLMGARAQDLLTAVVMTAPGTILIAKMLIPETETPETAGHADLEFRQEYSNVLDAISHGVTDGMYLAATVGAMLIAFVALIALSNGILGGLHTSLQAIFGYALGPVAWIIGVPWKDARIVGSLMATKLVLNEFIAFSMLGPLKATIAARSYAIATYALCGFSNFGSIGIQIGAIGALAPSRKKDLAQLGFRALLAATLANYLSASIAGIFLR